MNLWKLTRDVPLAKECAEQGVAANSNNRNLAALAAIPERIGKHMKVFELREECQKRGLSDSGRKFVLVWRLDEYDPSAASVKAGASAAAAKAAVAEADMVAETPFSGKDLRQVAEELSGFQPIHQPISLRRRAEREIREYVVEAALDDDESPLRWWKLNESRFSHLSLLARRLFSIAGSTAELERMFSRSSGVANAKRPRISGKTATEIMFCHENMIRGAI